MINIPFSWNNKLKYNEIFMVEFLLNLSLICASGFIIWLISLIMKKGINKRKNTLHQ